MLEKLLKSFSDDNFSSVKGSQTLLETTDLVIIDSSVDELPSLVNGTKKGTKVVVLDSSSDGIEQITNSLRQYHNLDRVHIVTHGSPGSLQLGNSKLNSEKLQSDRLAVWSEYLVNTSLLIYGCETASGTVGENFVRRLHEVTGANIAAASHIVGNVRQGGSWELNYRVGEFEPELAFTSEAIASYSGTFIDVSLSASPTTLIEDEGTETTLTLSLDEPPPADGLRVVIGTGIPGALGNFDVLPPAPQATADGGRLVAGFDDNSGFVFLVTEQTATITLPIFDDADADGSSENDDVGVQDLTFFLEERSEYTVASGSGAVNLTLADTASQLDGGEEAPEEEAPEEPVDEAPEEETPEEETPEEETPEEPVDESSEEETPEEPVDESSEEEAPEEETPEEPVDESSEEEAPEEETPEEPVDEAPEEETPEEETPEEPVDESPEEESPEEPVDESPEEESPEEPVDEAPEEETPEEPVDESPEEESPEEPVDEAPEEETPEEPVDESSEEETPEEPVDEAPEEETPEEPVDESSEEETPEEPVDESPEEETPEEETPEEPVDESSEEETPEEPVDESPEEETPEEEESPEEPVDESSEEETPEEETPEEPVDEAPEEESPEEETPEEETPEEPEPDDGDEGDISFEAEFGTLDSDVIEVEGSNQLLFAGDMNDLIDASTNEGGNRLYAGSGDDTLILGEGDRLLGGAGDDRFFATSGGDNLLSGGEGHDQFWVATAEIPDSTNTITDFTDGEDVIGIAGLGIGFEDVSLSSQGDDALISANGNDLALLSNVDITNLSGDDFAFG